MKQKAKPSAASRREIIIQMVEDQGFCTIAELSLACHVSEMTVRRDVQTLVESGLLRSFHGGVSPFPSQEFAGSDYEQREGTGGTVKNLLATEARKIVSSGDSIALDAGTTMAALAHALDGLEDLNVVTASLPALSALADKESVSVTVLGGAFNSVSKSMSGPATLASIENLHVDTFFLAASRLSERGTYCANDFDAVTKRALIEVADRVVLVSDSSKFDQSAIAKVCDWSPIDIFIVDDDLPKHMQSIIQEKGVDLRLVPAHSKGA